MATYTHTQVTTTRHEWRIPNATYGGFGAPVAEMQKAIAAAEVLYTDIHGAPPDYDRWLCAWTGDDEIVLWFEVEG